MKFSTLVSVLKKNNYSVYCPDLPGFGSMPKPDRVLNLDDYVNFVLDYLKKNNIGRADFICHSFGGRIGIKLAAFHPGCVRKLILTGVPGIVPVKRIKIIFFLVLAKFGKVFFSLPLINRYQILAQKTVYRMAKATDYYNTDLNLRETFQSVVSEKLENYLNIIKAPTLLLWGENDTVVNVGIARRMSRFIKNNKLIIVPGTAHGFPFTDSGIFFRKTSAFINQK